MEKIPTTVIEYNVYLGTGGAKLAGVAQIDLPEVTMLKTELNPSGGAGKLNIPSIGQTEAMTATIAADMNTRQLIRAAIADGQTITARAAVQVYNPNTGKNEVQAHSYVMRGQLGGFKSGQLKKGETMGSSIEFDLDYYMIWIDGKEELEVDKLNNIFRVSGTDQMSAVRNAI